MKVWPVILDSAPAFVESPDGHSSLLCAPLGLGALASELGRQVSLATSNAPTIVAPRRASESYRAHIQEAAPGAGLVTTAKELSGVLAGAESSDMLLFVDARWLPVDGTQLAALVEAAATQPKVTRHLVAYAADIAGTRESVNVDPDGHVQSVHRYYKPSTWTFIAGVAASLVPISAGVLPLLAVPESLEALRKQLVARGVPSLDVAIRDGAFDLAEEHGLLAAMEHAVRQAGEPSSASDRGSAILRDGGHQIDPTARLLGPMVIHANARIAANVTIVGPAVIGADTRIESGALIAHAMLGRGALIPAGRTLRDRAWFSPVEESPEKYAANTAPSFTQRLARVGFEPADADESSASGDLPTYVYPVVKRVFDVTVSAVALVFLSPLLALIAALVKLDSRGPVFFMHTREGVGERPFKCLKFRTMRDGADDLQRKLKAQDKMDGPHFKMKADPRITRLGRWLRATNVDELPQLVNVLLGDMSLVGPRPSPFRENQICVPWRQGRLSVRPGITGLWQVCRQDRDAADFHQWIEYDLLYVQHIGLRLDLKVLAATLFTLGGKFPVPVSRLLSLPARPAHPVVPAGSSHAVRTSNTAPTVR